MQTDATVWLVTGANSGMGLEWVSQVLSVVFDKPGRSRHPVNKCLQPCWWNAAGPVIARNLGGCCCKTHR